MGAVEMQRAIRRRLLVTGAAMVGLTSACAGAPVMPAGSAVPAGRSVSAGGAVSAGSAVATVTAGARPAVAGTPLSLTAASGRVAWAVVAAANGTDRVVVRTGNGGRTWRDVTPPRVQATAEFVFLGARHAWASAGRELLTTANGGVSWQTAGVLPGRCGVLQFVDLRHGWCVSSGAAAGLESIDLYSTSDGGRAWSLVSRTQGSGSTAFSLPFSCEKAISFASASIGSAGQDCAGNVDVLYVTTDGGSRWTPRRITGLPPSLSRAQIDIGPAALAGRLGAGSITVDGTGLLLDRTSDAGTSWQAVVPPGGIGRWWADVISPLAWRLATAERILATSDGGRTWRVIVPHWPLPRVSPQADLPIVDFVSATTGWAEFDYHGRFATLRTTDGGVSWGVVQTP
jgi:hypothetical protein